MLLGIFFGKVYRNITINVNTKIMKLSDIKNILPTLENVAFELENGKFVPEHFHVTEIGMITRNFIDCGGIIRNEKAVNFQLWNANDFEHRLKPAKLLNIIKLSEDKLGIEDAEIEVEYQNETIGRYDLAFNGRNFVLKNKSTACLAQESCGVPLVKEGDTAGCCAPDSSCC